MFRGKCRALWLITFTFLMLSAQISAAYAQSGQAQVVGTIKDSSGAVIAGATVTVVNERTGSTRMATTNERGSFVVPGLQPSTYSVKTGASGFVTIERKGVTLLAGDSVTLDSTLNPAGITESIVVTTTQEDTVDTSSARIGANVNEREVGGLPLNGRQLSQLYLQAPGSVNTGSGTFFDMRFSGRSNEENAIRYDGVEGGAIIDSNPGNLNGEISSPFRLQASLENVQEFRVDSSQYPAEYGTGSGAQVSVVTKSGTNQFHGGVFEYLRNDALDARNFFDKVGKSPLRLNQFGASLGGPLQKENLFFFGSYEGYRLRSGINNIEAVPSLSLKTKPGVAPEILPLIDAFRGPGAFVLPGASTDPNFDILQLPTNVAVDENSASLRLDYKINSRYTMYTRYMRDQGVNTTPEGVTGRVTTYRSVPQNAVLALQGSFTPTLLNEIKFGFNEALTRAAGTAPVVNGIDLSKIAINLSGNVANTGIPGQGGTTGIAVAGGLIRGSSAFNGSGFPYTPYSISLIDSLNWVKGNHNIKFGGEVRLLRLYLNIFGGTTYSFDNVIAFIANKASKIQYGGDLSDPSPFNNGATGNRLAKTAFYIGYAQDEWKLRPDLTLNYGLRYEYYSPLREDRDLDVQFNADMGTMPPPDHPFMNASKTSFGPRIGLAWSPNYSGKGFLGGGKTVLRAGFGIYYGPGQMEDQIQPIQNDRINVTTSGSYPINIPALVSNFSSNPNNRQYQPRSYAPGYSIPERIYQYSFSIQQQLPLNLNMTVAYVGSQGRNLFLRSITNKITQVRPDGTVIREFDIVQPDGTVLHPYAEIDYKTSGGWDSYDSMQVSFGRRFGSGLTMNSQYTWGRSYGNSGGSNDADTSSDPYDFNFENGYNKFDVRQSFNLSALYTLPLMKNGSGAAKKLLGDWEVGTIFNARTGLPINVLIGRNDIVYVDSAGLYYNSGGPGRTAVINTPGGGSSRGIRRPDVVPGVNPFLDADRAFLNPAAFSIPKPGTFGNLMRNALHGPDFRQLDFVANKHFRISESSNVQFRAEFFNIFNITNFGNPPATLPNVLGTGTNQLQPGQPYTAAAAGTFGILNSTVEKTVGQGTSRQIQFALRFNF
jgi:hypothetical protein